MSATIIQIKDFIKRSGMSEEVAQDFYNEIVAMEEINAQIEDALLNGDIDRVRKLTTDFRKSLHKAQQFFRGEA